MREKGPYLPHISSQGFNILMIATSQTYLQKFIFYFAYELIMRGMDLVLFRFRSGIFVILKVSRIISLIIFVEINVW